MLFIPGCDVNSAERGVLSGWMLAVPRPSDVRARVSVGAAPAHRPTGASAAGRELRGRKTVLPGAPTGHREKGRRLHSLANHRFSHFHYGSERFMSKISAYGHAMIAEKKYS